jgi:methylated-DNA-[protein]-cysteine S-methyltransferase
MKFEKRVWKLLKKIPRGKITTYRLLAKKMNSKAYRAVGSACHKNTNPNVPCYRVVRSGGIIGICHLDSCHKNRIRRLKKDGIKIKGNRILNFDEVLFKF